MLARVPSGLYFKKSCFSLVFKFVWDGMYCTEKAHRTLTRNSVFLVSAAPAQSSSNGQYTNLKCSFQHIITYLASGD